MNRQEFRAELVNYARKLRKLMEDYVGSADLLDITLVKEDDYIAIHTGENENGTRDINLYAFNFSYKDGEPNEEERLVDIEPSIDEEEKDKRSQNAKRIEENW